MPLTVDALVHTAAVVGRLRDALPAQVSVCRSGELSRDPQSGLPTSNAPAVEVYVERTAVDVTRLRESANTTRSDWNVTVVSVGNTRDACARIKQLVSAGLDYHAIPIAETDTTPLQFEYGEAPDQITAGVWSAVDTWNYTH